MGSIVRSAFVLSILPFPTATAWARDVPRRPGTIVVPAAPGGSGDTTTRLLARGPKPVPGFESLPLAGATVGRPLDVGSRRALAGPAGLAPEVVTRWEAAVHAAVESPDFRAAMADADFGGEPAAPTIRDETETARVMGALGYGE